MKKLKKCHENFISSKHYTVSFSSLSFAENELGSDSEGVSEYENSLNARSFSHAHM